jgi:hypothetical protein
MPRPCAVVGYVGFYGGRLLLSADATALCRGISRLLLASDE